jgi:hypothetical protein
MIECLLPILMVALIERVGSKSSVLLTVSKHEVQRGGEEKQQV